MTYKVGTIGEFAAWTKEVVRNPAAADTAPRRWFDSASTARAARREDVSAEAMVKLLSPENIRMLRIIARRRPESMRRLADLTGRKESNLSRTLKKLERAGLIGFRAGPGRMRAPVVIARRVRLEIDLTGPR